MTQEELKQYTIPVKYNGMIIGGDMVDYPKTIHVTPVCIGTGCYEVGLALTANESRKEYIDLSQVWHDPSEKPAPERTILVFLKSGSFISCCSSHNIDEIFETFEILKWAYVKDLLPEDLL